MKAGIICALIATIFVGLLDAIFAGNKYAVSQEDAILEIADRLIMYANKDCKSTELSSCNAVLGRNSGSELMTGDRNFVLGNNSGNKIGSGSDNILIGDETDVPAHDTSDFINIRNKVCFSLKTGEKLKCPAAFIQR